MKHFSDYLEVVTEAKQTKQQTEEIKANGYKKIAILNIKNYINDIANKGTKIAGMDEIKSHENLFNLELTDNQKRNIKIFWKAIYEDGELDQEKFYIPITDTTFITLIKTEWQKLIKNKNLADYNGIGILLASINYLYLFNERKITGVKSDMKLWGEIAKG